MADLRGKQLKDSYQNVVTRGTGNKLENGNGVEFADLDDKASLSGEESFTKIQLGTVYMRQYTSNDLAKIASGQRFRLTYDLGTVTQYIKIVVSAGTSSPTRAVVDKIIAFRPSGGSFFDYTENTRIQISGSDAPVYAEINDGGSEINLIVENNKTGDWTNWSIYIEFQNESVKNIPEPVIEAQP